jgi:hypothetical protein
MYTIQKPANSLTGEMTLKLAVNVTKTLRYFCVCTVALCAIQSPNQLTHDIP